jgi:hypothetical protein
MEALQGKPMLYKGVMKENLFTEINMIAAYEDECCQGAGGISRCRPQSAQRFRCRVR